MGGSASHTSCPIARDGDIPVGMSGQHPPCPALPEWCPGGLLALSPTGRPGVVHGPGAFPAGPARLGRPRFLTESRRKGEEVSELHPNSASST